MRNPALLDHISQHLYTAVLSDSLDSLGRRRQVMREYIRPVHSRYQVVAGYAHTIAFVDSDEVLENPFDAEIEAVDFGRKKRPAATPSNIHRQKDSIS